MKGNVRVRFTVKFALLFVVFFTQAVPANASAIIDRFPVPERPRFVKGTFVEGELLVKFKHFVRTKRQTR